MYNHSLSMSNQFIDIESFAKLANFSVNTVRRKIKSLSETDKKTYIQYIPVIGRGGQKTMLDKALITHWVHNDYPLSTQKTEQNEIDYSLGTQEKDAIQEQIKEPKQLPNDAQNIIDILRGQIDDKNKELEYRNKENDIKNAQIADLSKANSELIERLKEVNYTLATAQKQLSAPQDETPAPRWWQFWK
jgi:hypothetical protein